LRSDKDDPGWATLSNSEVVSEVLHVGVDTVDLAESEIEEQLLEDTVSTNEASEAVIKLNKWLGLHKCSAEQQKTTFQLEQFIRDEQFTNYSKQSRICFFKYFTLFLLCYSFSSLILSSASLIN